MLFHPQTYWRLLQFVLISANINNSWKSTKDLSQIFELTSQKSCHTNCAANLSRKLQSFEVAHFYVCKFSLIISKHKQHSDGLKFHITCVSKFIYDADLRLILAKTLHLQCFMHE